MPGSLWAVLAVLGLLPGWIFLVKREKHLRGATRSGFGELLQVAVVGAGLTGTALLIWSIFSEAIAPLGFVSLNELAASGGTYLAAHPRHVITTLALVLSAACLFALLLATYIYQSLHDAYKPGSSWEQAFSGVPQGKGLWLGIQLTEGPLVEGVLHSFDIAEASDGNRDVVLRHPIYVTINDARGITGLDRLVISSEQMQYMSAIHIELASENSGV